MESCVTLVFCLSLFVYNFPDEHIFEQREVTFDPNKKGVCIHVVEQNRCKDQLESQMLGVALDQFSLAAILGFRT